MHYSTYVEKIELFQSKYLLYSQSVLDLGCGPGNNAKILLQKNPTYKITGIDLSERMIQLAKENVSAAEFLVGDVRYLDIKKSYNAVLASFCIVHLQMKETLKLINQISSILSNNGYLYLSFMTGKESGFERTSFSEDEIYFNYYEIDDIIRYLDSCSLEILEQHVEGYQEEDGTITEDVFIFAQKKR